MVICLFCDYVGNAVADALAGIASNASHLPQEVRELAQGRVHLHFKVCLRLAILERCAKRCRDEMPPTTVDVSIPAPVSTRVAAEELTTAIANDGHLIHKTDQGRIRCSKCGVQVTASMVRSFSQWPCSLTKIEPPAAKLARSKVRAAVP